MPLSKKLTCQEAVIVVKAFFQGAAVKDIAEHFEVTRLTVSRLLRRDSYKQCQEVNALTGGDYLDRVEVQMKENSKRGRGNKEGFDFESLYN